MGSEQLDREVAGHNLARSSLAWVDAGVMLGGSRAPCPYPQHRATDWSLPGGPAVCGVCHPPAPGVLR